MGRFIDANELKEYIKIWDIGNGIGHGQSNILNAIDKQPTAYDVDAVVEQLDNEFMVVKTDDELMWNRAIDKAIEIVEGGGRFNG